MKNGGSLILKNGAEIRQNLIVELDGRIHRKGSAFGKSTVYGAVYVNIFSDKEKNFLKDDNNCLNVNKLVIYFNEETSFGPKALHSLSKIFTEKSKINSILNQKGDGCD